MYQLLIIMSPSEFKSALVAKNILTNPGKLLAKIFLYVYPYIFHFFTVSRQTSLSTVYPYPAEYTY